MKVVAVMIIAAMTFYKAIFLPYAAENYLRELSEITATWLSRESQALSYHELTHGGKLKWIKVKLSKQEAYRRYKVRLQRLHEQYSFLF